MLKSAVLWQSTWGWLQKDCKRQKDKTNSKNKHVHRRVQKKLKSEQFSSLLAYSVRGNFLSYQTQEFCQYKGMADPETEAKGPPTYLSLTHIKSFSNSLCFDFKMMVRVVNFTLLWCRENFLCPLSLIFAADKKLTSCWYFDQFGIFLNMSLLSL